MAQANGTHELFSDITTCYSVLTKDRSDGLTLDEFNVICQTLFCNSKGIAYAVPDVQIAQIFTTFDQNGDGYIDWMEFEYCWNEWITPILHPVSALVIVDVQNDFISGSLSLSNCSAKQDGQEIIEPINKLLDRNNFELVVYTLDWHPSDHISFIENVNKRRLHCSSPTTAANARAYDTVVFDGCAPIEQILWPAHCVQNTWGAQLHKDLSVVENAVELRKGTNSDVDSYSAFSDNRKAASTTLDAQLKAKRVTDVYVCGLAYDICVAATAINSIECGYRTILIDDCCRGTNVDKIDETKQTITSSNGIIVFSEEVDDMIHGHDRRPQLALKQALRLAQRREQSDFPEIPKRIEAVKAAQ